MNTYVPGQFADLAKQDDGKLWEWLNRSDTVVALESAAKLRRPGVEVIAKEIPKEFPHLLEFEKPVLDRYRQMIGHMIRQVMEPRGYNIDRQGVPVSRGDFFGSGTRYREPQDN